MSLIKTILTNVLLGAAALGLLFLITNGTFNCSKNLFSSYYTCSATVIIPVR